MTTENLQPPGLKVVVNEIDTDSYKNIASIEEQNGFTIQKNRDPIPEQEIVVIVSYQNMENYVSNGKLYLFYNENNSKTIILNWLTLEHMPVNEKSKKILLHL
jgi:phenylpyruvate tautomerase PptA (4-oxalocrotonate tautomerase family)